MTIIPNGKPEPRWDRPWAVGAQGELFVDSIVRALCGDAVGVEVKTDEIWPRTKRVYVEYQCLYHSGWGPSGLQKTEAKIWIFVIGHPQSAYMYQTDFLRSVCDPHWASQNPELRRDCRISDCPTQGLAVPTRLLESELRQRSLGQGGS